MRVLLVVACALLASACERREPAAQAGAGSNAGVTAAQAANAIYPSENTGSGRLALVDGHYEDRDMVSADLDPLGATADVDGDGTVDRAVLLVTSTGGSGVFRELYLLRRKNGALQVSAPALLGDRVEVNDLRIEHGDIVVDLVVQGADDPLCCPTLAVTYRFRLVDDALVETTGQRRVYLKE